MDKINVIDVHTNKVVSEVEIPEKIKECFNFKNAKYVLHEYVVAYLANQRQGTHSTKTRAEVRGGGRKPWVQKHTGRARQGSIRSPLWRKGGVVFGPKPRDYYIKLPKKKKRLAKYLALAEKIKSDNLIVVEDFKLDTYKTKVVKNILNNLGLDSKKILIIDKELDNNLKLATRNLENVETFRINDINGYVLLNNEKIIITKEAWLCL
ncbi:MAG: 50S ribosomal protein L4 [Elusimicrobiota bacterium]|nr:50S ribosomal protein L4 [Endomicrobiia bacterium]MDW8166679.1 50S ribosomal protein L4 [Elusimicrobiota bacterium]